MRQFSLDEIKKLHQKKFRKQFEAVFVEGKHLVQELEKTSISECEIILSEENALFKTRFKTRVISELQFKKISDVETPQGIAAIVPLESFHTNTQSKRVVFLEEVQDPGNLGTILRTLAWFGEFELWLSTGSVDPFNPKVIRSSMGAIFHVPMKLNVTLDDVLNQFDSIAYLDLGGKNLSDQSFQAFECYIFGNEARGISDDVKNDKKCHSYSISGNGSLESLNLATAVNMTAYELNR